MTKRKTVSRRARARGQKAFPCGLFVGLLTAAVLTLIGVAMGFQPYVILMRSAISATIVGSTFSVGMSVVRLANAESKRQNAS